MTTDNSGFQAKYTTTEKDRLLAEYETAMNLTAGQKAIAHKLQEFYKGEFRRANKAGIIRHA